MPASKDEDSMHSSRFYLLPVVFCLLFASFGLAREWTDTAGRKVKGDFIELTEDGKVQLNVDGKILSIPLYRFSQADQEHIDALKNRQQAPPEEKVDNPFNSSSVPNPFESGGSEPVKSPFEPEESTPVRSSAPGINAIGARPVDSSDSDELDRRDLTKVRTWVDSSGNTIKAKYIRIHNGMVILSQSGRVVQSDFYKLSPGDQKFLRDHLTAIGQDHSIPAPPATIQTPEVTGPPQLAGGNTPIGGYNPGRGTTPPTGASTPPYSPGGAVTPPAYTPPPYDPGANTPNPGSMAGRNNPAGTSSPYSPGSNLGNNPSSPSRPGSNEIASNSNPHSSPWDDAASSPAATSSSPHFNSAPRSNPHSMPTMPEPRMPEIPQFETRVVYNCTNCNAEVSESAKSCPKCKAVFDYVQDENGRRTNLNNGSTYSSSGGGRIRIPVKLIVLGVFGVLSILGWMCRQLGGQSFH